MRLSDIARLAPRHREPEWMDAPGLDAREHGRALRGLGLINRLSRSASIFWPRIASLARTQTGGPLRVLDLACGGGDVTVALASRAARAKLDVRVEGADISDEAVRFARASAERRGVEVGFFLLNALRDPIPEGYDVILCSLFLHHLDEDDAVVLLEKMADATRRSVLVNDLERTRRGVLARAGGLSVAHALADREERRPHLGRRRVHGLGSDETGRGGGTSRGDPHPTLAGTLSSLLEPIMNRSPGSTLFDEIDASVWDAVVIGAGPAGALAARQLALGGARVLLVEKARFPRWKICGACLNGHALDALGAAGLGSLVDRLGAVGLREFRVGIGGGMIPIALPVGGGGLPGALRFRARG